MLSSFLPAASALSTIQFDWIQATGSSELQERQRCGEQQDEAGQTGTLQRHRSCSLRARRLLQRCFQTARHQD